MLSNPFIQVYNYILFPCQLGGRTQSCHWLSQKSLYSKHFDLIFLILIEALWVTERGQIRQHLRQFFSPKGPPWYSGALESEQFLSKAFSSRALSPSGSPSFTLPPCSPLLFLQSIWALLTLGTHFHIAHLCRLTFSKVLTQTKTCQVTETLSGRQFIHSLWLPGFAHWDLTFAHS